MFYCVIAEMLTISASPLSPQSVLPGPHTSPSPTPPTKCKYPRAYKTIPYNAVMALHKGKGIGRDRAPWRYPGISCAERFAFRAGGNIGA